MKERLLGILAVALLLLTILYVAKTQTKSQNTPEIILGNKHLNTEVADSNTERILGLSDRPELPENHSMLFIFPEKSIQTFWMKDMHFPLDIIWIDGQTIVGYEKNAHPEGSTPKKLYSSPKSVDKVLEVNAGTVDSLDLQIGQNIDLSNID